MAKMLMLNPAPRKRRRKARRKNPIARARTRTRVIRANPVRRVRRRRSNPIGGVKMGGIVNQTVNAFIGAGGAIGTDVIAKMLPLPASMQTGYMQDITRAGIAIALGLVVEKGLRQRATGRKMTEGALTVIAHGMALKAVGPNLGLSAYDDWNTGIYPGMTTAIYPNIGTGMGAYQNAAPVSGGATLAAYQNWN